jgi:hypothetical protein
VNYVKPNREEEIYPMPDEHKPLYECPFVGVENASKELFEKLFDTKIESTEKVLAQKVDDLDRRFISYVGLLETQRVHDDLQTKQVSETLQKTVDRTCLALDKRLDIINEFRMTLMDQAKTFYTVQQHENYAKPIEEDLRSLRDFAANASGYAKANTVFWNTILAILGLIGSIIAIVLKFVH